MTDAPTPSPAPSPAPAPAPTPAPDAPATGARPDWLPEPYWDAKAGALNTDEFGKHYATTAADAAKWGEWRAGVPEKPDGYKVELKLPDTVKVPEGVTFDPSKDPRLPTLLAAAHSLGLPNSVVNQLVALDAQNEIAEITRSREAVAQRRAEDDKKLGDKAQERRTAAMTWADGLATKGFTSGEVNEFKLMAATASGIATIEKLMARLNGNVPGHQQDPPPRVEPKTHADRIWPGGFSATPQAKVS